jgi:hypothetical protein
MKEGIIMENSELVKGIVKWMEEKIKKQKVVVQELENEKKKNFCCEELYNANKEELISENAKLNTLIELKISLEKYSKKLKHQGN